MAGKILIAVLGILVGYLLGVGSWELTHRLKDRQKDAAREIRPVITRQEMPVRIVCAKKIIPREELLRSVSPSWVSGHLQAELIKECWKYARVTEICNPTNLEYIYEARLKVVDEGVKNPLWEEEQNV